MANTHPDGTFPAGPLHADQLEQQGYQQCRNQLCEHMLDPQVLDEGYQLQGSQYQHTCSHCGLDQYPGLTPGRPGGGTNSGLPMEEQGQIGEDLVEKMQIIPGYGPILWWHRGGAGTPSALDGATTNWGIEVKTFNWTNVRKRGQINNKDKPAKARAVNDPAIFAAEMNDPALDNVLSQFKMKGLLGVLVLLDFETGTADIFGHEMADPHGGPLQPQHIKHITRQVVLAEGVPFTHSLPDPRQPGWVPAHMQAPAPTEAVPF
jgi:hypothetical protein